MTPDKVRLTVTFDPEQVTHEDLAVALDILKGVHEVTVDAPEHEHQFVPWDEREVWVCDVTGCGTTRPYRLRST